eukprot:5652106-Amphidinium_carterae.1
MQQRGKQATSLGCSTRLLKVLAQRRCKGACLDDCYKNSCNVQTARHTCYQVCPKSEKKTCHLSCSSALTSSIQFKPRLTGDPSQRRNKAN